MNRPLETNWVACLQERVVALADLPDRERRHAELMESVQSRIGYPLSTLELAYEIALEEGVDPALALELLVCRVAVIDLPEPAPGDETHSLAPPDWVTPVGLPEEAVELERRLRKTFRRLRSVLERHTEVGAAIDAFAAEPDIAHYDYQLVEGV